MKKAGVWDFFFVPTLMKIALFREIQVGALNQLWNTSRNQKITRNKTFKDYDNRQVYLQEENPAAMDEDPV